MQTSSGHHSLAIPASETVLQRGAAMLQCVSSNVSACAYRTLARCPPRQHHMQSLPTHGKAKTHPEDMPLQCSTERDTRLCNVTEKREHSRSSRPVIPIAPSALVHDAAISDAWAGRAMCGSSTHERDCCEKRSKAGAAANAELLYACCWMVCCSRPQRKCGAVHPA